MWITAMSLYWTEWICKQLAWNGNNWFIFEQLEFEDLQELYMCYLYKGGSEMICN